MTFDAAAVTALYDAAVSAAQKLSDFDRVNMHEPRSKPGSGLSCSFWGVSVRGITSSGLDSTSGLVTLNARIYASTLAKPEDGIDPKVMAAGSALIGAYSEGFTFGGTVRNVDLLGRWGEPLGMRLGYLEQDGQLYRVGEITIPIVVNDLWHQEA
jgi:hypothetical protein